MKNITNEDIANYINRDKKTISGWRQKQPGLHEIVKLGAFCKKNGLDEEEIKRLLKLQLKELQDKLGES